MRLVPRGVMSALMMMCATTIAVVSGAASRGALVPADPPPGIPPSLGLCPAALHVVNVRTYDVRGRVKMLLFWTAAHDQGTARLSWSEGPDDTRRTELLIGTDPDRAFRHMNRWGYIAETVCEERAEVVGVMTTADEASIDEAKASLDASSAATHAFRAIRARETGTESVADVLHVSTSRDYTYRDLASLFDKLPAAGTERHIPMPARSEPGFLAAVSSLMRQDLGGRAASGPGAAGAVRTYVYASTSYRLRLASSKSVRETTIGTTRYANPIEMRFELLNLGTHDTTSFDITAGTTGDVAGVPLRMTYRPRWWLQVELSLAPGTR